MKRFISLTGLVLMAFAFCTVESSAQTPKPTLRTAEKLTEKGFIDKKNTFNPDALDSLLKCDEYVMLISSYEGCTPCEWLRTSDLFDTYPISPYYNDFLLGGNNEIVPYILVGGGYPTCAVFDKNGNIVSLTQGGGGNLYEKMDKVTKDKEIVCEFPLGELSKEEVLQYYTLMYKAAASYIKEEMYDVFRYASEAMKMHPTFYNRYLLYQYYLYNKDMNSANKYRELLKNPVGREAGAYRKLIAELNAE